MNKLAKLRARLKALVDGLKTLQAKEDLTAEELAQIEKDVAEIDDVKKNIGILESAEKAAAAAASTVLDDADAADATTRDNLPAEARRENILPAEARAAGHTPGVLKLGMLGIATAVAKMNPDEYKSPLEALTKNGFSGLAEEVRSHTARIRSLQAGSAVNGGLVIPPSWSDEIIELLRPTTTFIAARPRRVPMPNGSFVQPGGATGATAAYGVELQNAHVTEQTFRDINMVAKELKALVPMSNQWLDFSIPAARAFVEADLRNAMSETLDQMAWIGDGLQGRPQGIFNIAGITEVAYTFDSTPTVAELDALKRAYLNAMEDRNVRGRMVWIAGSRAAGYIQDMRAGVSEAYAYPSMQGPNPTWGGIPFLYGTNLPQNLGLGGNESYLALVAMDHVLMGEAGGLTVSISTEAAYYDANGVLRSSFQRGETLLMMMMRHDFALRHLPAVAVGRVTFGGAA